MNQKETIEKYKNQSISYFENALVAMEAGEAEKTGELLWGSMIQALKAMAASEGKKITKYGREEAYARELAKRLGDESIFDVFGSAKYLHGRYYEAGLSMEEVYAYAERIRAVVGKLLSLVAEAAENRQVGRKGEK